MNAAKIAKEVQGKKKKNEGEGSGSGGFGDLVGGFTKHKPNKHGEAYEEERPHGSQYNEGKPHKAGEGPKKKPSTGELFGNAQTLYQAAAGKKVEQGQLADAASGLLDGLSMYGGENSPYGDYLKKASTYLDKHGQRHEIPVVPGSTKPPGGRPDEEFHASKPRPSKYEEEEYGAYPPKPRPTRYESEESEYSGRPQKPHASSEEYEYGGHPQRPRPSRYEEDSEYGARPQKPRPSKHEEEQYGVYPPNPRPHGPYEAEAGYGGRPQKSRPTLYEEEQYGGPRRPQKSQAPQYEGEEYGSGYSQKPHKPEYGEERPGPYGKRPQNTEGAYGSSEGPYGSAYGAASAPGYNLEEEYGKPKKTWHE